MFERTLVPSAGVTVEAGGWASTGLNVLAPTAEHACELGLVSEHWAWVGRTRRIRLAAAPRFRGRRLPLGVVRAALTSVAHNARGMAPWFALAVGLLLLGFAPTVSALAGVGWGLAGFLVSVLVHEAGHVVAFRAVSPEGAGYLVSRGARCHLVRPVLPRAQDRTVIVAGPLAPLLMTVVVWPIALGWPLLLLAWLVLALGHALILLAPVGDGANLRDRSHGQRPQ